MKRRYRQENTSTDELQVAQVVNSHKCLLRERERSERNMGVHWTPHASSFKPNRPPTKCENTVWYFPM